MCERLQVANQIRKENPDHRLHPIRDGVKILVAEDDPDNRALIGAFLKNENVRITFCENGQVAFDNYQKETGDYDLILTDIQMPVMNGFQLIHAIRSHEHGKNFPPTPIVAFTADAQYEQISNVMRLGANEYITKPLSKEKLRMTISRYQNLKTALKPGLISG